MFFLEIIPPTRYVKFNGIYFAILWDLSLTLIQINLFRFNLDYLTLCSSSTYNNLPYAILPAN